MKEVILRQPEPVEQRNKGTLTKPFMQTKGVSCRPHPCHKETQTDIPSSPAMVPMPTPMYIPVPVLVRKIKPRLKKDLF